RGLVANELAGGQLLHDAGRGALHEAPLPHLALERPAWVPQVEPPPGERRAGTDPVQVGKAVTVLEAVWLGRRVTQTLLEASIALRHPLDHVRPELVRAGEVSLVRLGARIYTAQPVRGSHDDLEVFLALSLILCLGRRLLRGLIAL